MPDQRIVLLGLRGSGKSTVGRMLARGMMAPFIDLDDRTLDLLREERGCRSISDAFDRHGEPVFRDTEVRALERVLRETEGRAAVVALGGGTPTAPGAGEMLRSSGAMLVYLRLPATVLAERLKGKIDARRPALTPGSDPIAEMAQVLEARDPQYRNLARIIIEDDLCPEELSRRIRAEIAGSG